MPTQPAALLLAAGSSRRMGEGRLKQLLALDGRPVLGRCAATLAEAGVAPIVVVLAPGVDAGAALAGLPATLVRNEDSQSDMAGSVRAGLGAVGAGATGVLVCLADHPLVAAATVRALAAAHRERPESILIPAHRGRRGHPALFPAGLIRELFAGGTLRDLREAHRDRVLELDTEDDGVLFDMDTWDDYQEACARVAQQCGPAGGGRG
jgi:molybdenum cofactor cytidylyltransferase